MLSRRTFSTSMLAGAAAALLPAVARSQNAVNPLYPTIETFPTMVDARHANKEAVDLFTQN